MDLQSQMDAATKSAQDQIDMTQRSIANQLDTADRMLMQKAANATIKLATAPTTADPT